MEPETIINLLDTYWYGHDFFKPKPKIPKIPLSDTEIPILPTIQTKSQDKPNTPSHHSTSPDSVLLSPSKLQTIFSGKESTDLDVSKIDKEFHQTHGTNTKTSSPLTGRNKVRRRKNKGLSKSLSDLEFEEVKGFMDLGFVFSEEDKDSILGSLIPGLQRLGQNLKDGGNDQGVEEEKKIEGKMVISRPYLSEAWELLDKKTKENGLMKWKVPSLNSEIDMKDYLRFWAHSVAKATTVMITTNSVYSEDRKICSVN